MKTDLAWRNDLLSQLRWVMIVCGLFGFLIDPLVAQTGDEDEPPQFTDEQLEFFENEVRPLLVDKCYDCHGPDSTPIEGSLNLASRKSIITGGDTGPAIVSGHPDKSLLIDAINYGDVYEMPPDTKMSKEEIATLTRWVQQGAPWPPSSNFEIESKSEFNLAERKSEHWCWQPIRKPKIPDVKNSDWPRDVLDNFVLARIEAAGLTPSEPAERAILIRRAYFDISGLPPTPAQVADFISDPSPNAFEKVVDQLLDSPRYGERWARHWMDLTRYAETGGHEFDYEIKHAHRYRDYLIRAFNEDVSYKQLVHEHIAGDLLPKPRRNPKEDYDESVLGTGFWFLGEAKHAPVDSKGEEARTIDNQIDVMSKTFLGLTVACARCHDHKFDAISTEDYYALSGFLQSSRRQTAMLDPGQKIEASFGKTDKLVSRGNQIAIKLQDQLAKANIKGVAKYLDASLEFLRADPDWNQTDADNKSPSIHEIATRNTLQPDRLERFVAAIQDPALEDSDHPLHVLFLASKGSQDLDSSFASDLKLQFKQSKKEHAQWLKDSTQMADFSNGLPDGWFRTGFAFENSPGEKTTTNQANVFSAAGPVLSDPNSIQSGRHGASFYGVVRSPTFELSDTHIHYLCRGRNGSGKNHSIRLIIDGYVMDEFNALLFKGCLLKIRDSASFHWETQAKDIKNHLGSRAHIEIIDQGDGFISVDEIRFSKGGKPIVLPSQFVDQLVAKGFETRTTFAEAAAAGCKTLLSKKSGDMASWVLDNELVSVFLNPNSNQTSSTRPPGIKSVALVTPRHGAPDKNKLFLELQAIRSQLNTLDDMTPPPRMAVAITDGTGEEERIFIRGNHKTLGDFATRHFLSAISNRPLNPPDGSGRLQLAYKITAPNNPLTTRVAVNRIWHHLLGRGIVETVDNFGVLGKTPSHPQLLDYLASEFASNGQSFKRIIKRIVLSQTYQMSSQPSESGAQIDPENNLLHRARIRRLQGEAIRDSILQVTGSLDLKMFGPPVPIYLTPFMDGRGRPKKSGPLDGSGRRSIYVAVRRNFLSPMMLAFDTPIPFNSAGARNQSNVPAQALILMNDPFVIQQAERWSKQLIAAGQTSPQRIDSIYRSALGRGPTELELKRAMEFTKLQAAELGVEDENINSNPEIWQDVCHVIFNMKEFIYIP